MKVVKATNGNAPARSATLPSLWNDFFQSPFPDFSNAFANLPERFRVKSPAVDVSEDSKEVTVKAEAAGMSEKDIELSHLDGVLYIKGEKKEEKEESGKNTWHKESWSGSFTRSIPLGDTVDFAKAQARFKDGVLTVRLPKKEAGTGRKPNTIAIQ